MPIFGGGCALGVFASKVGGVRGTIIATFLMGIIEVLGSVWLAQVIDFKIAGGGPMDYCTYSLALMTILKELVQFVK
jgi:PTS system ascorbate-specific IIC component